MRRRTGWWAIAAAVIIVVGVIVAFRQPLAQWGIAEVAGVATKTHVSFGRMSLHARDATFADVRIVSRSGAPIAYIPRIDVRYDTRDLLPGSSHRFGLHEITVEHPQITIVRYKNGTYNVPLPAHGVAAARPASPLAFTARVSQGTLTFTDLTRTNPVAQHIYLDAITVGASVNTASSSHYTASLNYREADNRYPIRGSGTIDAPAGFTLHHWTAGYVPLPRLIGYALNNPTIRMTKGELTHLDARYFNFTAPGAKPRNHFAASATMNDATVTIAGVHAPIRDGHGAIDLYDGGLTTRSLDATIAGAPVHISGGIFNLSHPVFRLAVGGRGDAAKLKQIASAAAKLPLQGPLDFGLLLEGSVKAPLTLIAIRSPQIEYRGIPLNAAQALVAFDGHEADVMSLSTRYSAFDIAAAGRIALKSGPNAVQMLAHIDGPGDALPYLSAVAPGMHVHGSVLATASNLKRLETHGFIEGAGSNRQMTALFGVNGSGAGVVGPVAITSPRGSLYARIALDHPHNSFAALVHARNFAIGPAAPVALPGFNVKPLPALRGTLDGTLYADRTGGAIGMIGAVNLDDAAYGKFSIAHANAQFGGSEGDVRISSLDAFGEFGRLQATGNISSGDHIALAGRYTGSLAALAQIAGNLPANGSVDAPIAVLYDGSHTVAQIQNAQFGNADVRGVPLNALSATVGVRGKDIAVYSAQARVAQTADALAAGTVGSNSNLALSVSQLDLAQMPAVKAPIHGGVADVAATAQGSLQAPQLAGAALLTRGLLLHYPIDVASAFAYAGDTMRLHDAIVGVGPAFVTADGAVSGIALGAPMHPQYDLQAAVKAADLHSVIALAQPKLVKQHIEGSVDAQVHVGGGGNAPFIDGAIQAPEGSINGLAFRNLHATLSGTPQTIGISGGHVAVGSTALAFTASVAGRAIHAHVNAPHADLADFNDYFDAADTLSGTGSVAADFAMSGNAIASDGNVNLAGVRFRRFEVGNTVARWHTAGNTTQLAANVGGATGTAHIQGSMTIPSFSGVGGLLAHAGMNLHASVRNIDLGTWMPMLGYNAPVTGFLNADASVRGRYPDVTMAANAALAKATVGRIPVQQARVTLQATGGRGTLTRADVQIPYFSATGSGTFGLHANDPLALTLHGISPNFGALMKTASGKAIDLSGALDTTLHVSGTRLNPLLSDDLTLNAVKYRKFTVPRILASIGATRRDVTLHSGEIDLQRGRILASGRIPVVTSPHFGVGPGRAPVAFALTAQDVDASNAAAMLPKGTTLRGRLDGRITVGGAVDAPRLGGAVALSNGYFVGPVDQNPIRNVVGSLQFSGTQVALQNVHADVGGGTLAMNGTASVPTVRDIRAATFRTTIVAKGAQFNSPQYFRGKADANVTVSRGCVTLSSEACRRTTIGGTLYIPTGRIPLTAFWNPKAPKGPAKALPDIGLNLNASVGNDVRVQAPNVDVGARGHVAVTGTLPKPALSGAFVSTGGTINFLHTFTIQSARVRFDPANGIMPYVDATATTAVQNPTTYIAMHVTGLAPSDMNIAFSSDPAYNKSQILGLLVGAQNFGAVSGVQTTGGGSFSTSSIVQNLALGQLNSFFTTQLLEPMSASIGNALGLQNLQLSNDFTSGFGISAAKAFGNHITATYNEDLAPPRRQTLTIEARRGRATAFSLMLYNVQSPTLLGFLQASNVLGNTELTQAQIFNYLLGTHGVSLLYQHKF